MKLFLNLVFVLMLFQAEGFSQEIEIFQQFNGRYDYQAVGNTLNIFENNLFTTFCETLPSSSAQFYLEDDSSTIIAAYLYWAGSGEGDLNVTLSGQSIDADNVYNVEYNDPFNGTLVYFSCYADITDFMIANGNMTYELHDLDISDVLTTNPGYCNNRTNFAGWSIYVIYENAALPLNQIGLYQGLEIIDRNIQEKIIVIDNLNVLDNENAKIGFLAWEGDNSLNFGESLSINDNVLSNPPLNEADNAFNGTNTFTNSTEFYNCDLDVYDIQNNISIGDTSATIRLTTGALDNNGNLQADLIILNNIITVLNSQLPDASISANNYNAECFSRDVELNYTVYNTNSTEFLPANTPIAFYLDNLLIATSQTQNHIPIGGFENGNITISLPESIPDTFTIDIIVDDDGTGIGIITETNETNNDSNISITLLPLPPIIELPPLNGCDIGFDTSYFDLTASLEDFDLTDVNETIFYTSLEDLQNNTNEILIPEYFQNMVEPQAIYIKLVKDICYEIAQFNLIVENCPPHVPQGFSPNDDSFNDWFNIQGLYDIFEEHKLLIFNRYGTLIFEGDNSLKWDGKANRGINNQGKLLPVGTYFYVLHLNDPNYTSLTGWVYLNR